MLFVLPIVSLVLYLIGFFISFSSPGFVLYMAVAGLAVAIFSYKRFSKMDAYNPKPILSKYFSLVLIVVGVVFLLSAVLSIFALGPFISSLI